MRTRKEMLLLRKLTDEEEQELIKMYRKVECDLENYPSLKTTEDFFRWRDDIKNKHGNNGRLRTKILEKKIEGNESLMLLYKWSQFVRIVARSIANVNLSKIDMGIIDYNKYSIDAPSMLMEYLKQNQKGDEDRLIGLYRIDELELRSPEAELREVHTEEEYVDALVNEDYQQPWPLVPFLTLMKAYGIDGNDLLIVGKWVEQTSKAYISDMIVNYESSTTDKKAKSGVQYKR